jgi:hypothetical protein
MPKLRIQKTMNTIVEKKQEKKAEEVRIKEEIAAKQDDIATDINKPERYYGVQMEEPDTRLGQTMPMEFKLQSMLNAVKILPPNFVRDGRHKKENIRALCGFVITDEMMDEVYSNYKHPEY